MISALAHWADRQLIGPGASAVERAVGYATAVAGCTLTTAVVATASMPSIAVVVVAVVAFDLFGGAAVNATSTAKRHFHRPGRTARHHLGFVAAHIQPFLLALAVPGFGWAAAATIYGLALAGAVVVTAVNAESRRPVAFAVTVLAITAVAALVTVPPELAWFAPVLLIKLLLAHLLPEDAPR
ncbi:hypothetical protein [Streptomyces luteolus]|uniref:Integral membrane protein n=1 Tax=Streptomyces luteolus TaxID=3043615 RepID=A0ABT6T2L2_9ACTN|nr:hypothetical protein [Streptomyces sp. B-S-A12]MDI3421645.1 hypothetical protein [Streptomyces sp. B-S-A12]